MPAWPSFGAHRVQGHPAQVDLQSQRDLGHPPQVELQSQRDLGHPPGLFHPYGHGPGSPDVVPGHASAPQGDPVRVAEQCQPEERSSRDEATVARLGEGGGAAAGNSLRATGLAVDNGEVSGHRDPRSLGRALEPSIVATERGASHGEAAGVGVADVGSPLDLLAKGIQQLQELHLRKESQDPELLKGNVEIPKLPEPYQEGSAVAFLEWVYETGQVVGSITDRAAVWWESNLALALQAYKRFQHESPLNRLKIQVGEATGVDEQKWSRLEKRVMTLLLQSMPSTIKNEITMLRISKVKDCLFKLCSIYAPGGATERASLIRQLESIPVHEGVLEVTLALRKWKKLLGRASEMGVSLPDGSVLLVAVEAATRKVVEGHRDIAFKLNMAKQNLQLPHLPLVASVLAYVDHILAELQQVIPLGRGDVIKLKGLQSDPSSPTSSANSPTRPGGAKNGCKYFLSDDGCRRGASCKYSHEFATKEEKRNRCWDCGSTKHRRKECPVAAKQKGPKTTAASIQQRTDVVPSASASSSTMQPPLLLDALQDAAPPRGEAQALPTTGTTSSAASTVLLPETKERDVQELLKEANAVLNKFVKLQALQAQTNESVGMLDGVVRSIAPVEGERSALLDSGASHPFRAPRTNQEHHEAKRVAVQLADGRTVRLRQTHGGTLLPAEPSSNSSSSCTILPLGSLVESLGCSLRWSKKKGLQVFHPRYGLLPTKLVGNCPVLREHEALRLISDLEDLELARLREQTMVGAVQTLDASEASTLDWSSHLEEFLSSGQRVSLRRMLRDPNCPLHEEEESKRMAVVGDLDLNFSESAGAKFLKALPFSRARRRRLLRTRWIVHLFSGEEGVNEFTALENDETTVVNVDIRVSKGLDLMDDGVFRALLWAAGRGQVEGVFGGPPRGSGEGPSLLVSRMMMLWTLAQQGAVRDGLRIPFFAMELPPRHPFWRSPAWEHFNAEYDFPVVQVHGHFFAADMDVQGAPVTLEGLSGENWSPISTWPPSVRLRLAAGMASWRQSTRTVRMARAMARLRRSPESMSEAELRQWEAHIRNGHVPYSRRCATCVRAAGTGRAHRRTLAPSAYTLSLDLAGPFRHGAECADGSGFRYALVGSYCHPRLEGLMSVIRHQSRRRTITRKP